MHVHFGAHTYNEGHFPLLASSPRASVDEEFEADLNFSSWEHQVILKRPHHEKPWAKECDERERDITATRLLHTYGTSAQQARRERAAIIRPDQDLHRVHINPLATGSAESQRPSLHSAQLSTTSYPTETTTYEQQTGIIRSIADPVEVHSEQLEASDGSSASSLRRRGAVKRKMNPLFARPTYGGDLEHRPVTR
jgi:hypothetical protein